MCAAINFLLTHRVQKIIRSLLLFVVICLLIVAYPRYPSQSTGPSVHVQQVSSGQGGKWHIPQSWAKKHTPCGGSHILEAAECALGLALRNEAFMDNTRIPLIAHQTSRSANPSTWSSVVLKCIERWLEAAKGVDNSVEMAWFMWDDEGLEALVQKYESKFYSSYAALPYPVEKADAFRVLVLKWFGGVYGDIDSKPLTHPSRWVEPVDLAAWTDENGNNHTQHQPLTQAYIAPKGAPTSYAQILRLQKIVPKKTVSAIFGIEADNSPAPDDTYWRMGYSYPVQLTNWALAMAPQHPIAEQFLSALASRIQTDKDDLPRIDPLDLTGPPALTRIVKAHAEKAEPGLVWQSLSSLGDHTPGGHSKIIAGDALILPITGFSPGRGKFRNMGSQPTSHPAARLQHLAAGSWRKPDFRVEYGKFCRTVFGMCREWSKFPDP